MDAHTLAPPDYVMSYVIGRMSNDPKSPRGATFPSRRRSLAKSWPVARPRSRRRAWPGVPCRIASGN